MYFNTMHILYNYVYCAYIHEEEGSKTEKDITKKVLSEKDPTCMPQGRSMYIHK